MERKRSRPTKSYSPQEGKNRTGFDSAVAVFEPPGTANSLVVDLDSFSFIAAGPLRGRMAILSIGFGIIGTSLCKNHGVMSTEKTNK